MQIIKNKRHWVCYPENRTEFTELVEWCRKNFGRSHWSIFNKTWCTRGTGWEEQAYTRYERVVEIHSRDIAIQVQLIWG